MNENVRKIVILNAIITVVISSVFFLIALTFISKQNNTDTKGLQNQISQLETENKSLRAGIFRLQNCNAPITGYWNGSFVSGVARLGFCY
mgnify:CR=1 FL=1